MSFIFSFFLFLYDFSIQIYYSIKRIVVNIIVPHILQFLVDIHFISLIVFQGILDIVQRLCLFLSKNLLNFASKCQEKSKELIDRTWIS